MNNQYVLRSRGCSGRGVRVRVLSPSQRAAITDTAAKETGTEGTVFQFRVNENTAGICAMVFEYTEKTGFKSVADLNDAKIEWKKTNVEEMTDKHATIFNAKDLAMLARIFRGLHDVSDDEVNDILGEGQEVAEA